MLESFTYWLFDTLLWMLIEPEGCVAFWILWTFLIASALCLLMWTRSTGGQRDAA